MVGSRLGVYEITRLIGAGRLGAVYEARDTSLGRRVAIRMLHTDITADPERLARLQHHARAAMALEHPSICRLYDVGPEYLVMEFVEGFPPEPPLIESKALEYSIQVLAALEAAHGMGIVHGDLTPDNVLITSAGVKVLDFGLPRPTHDIGTDIHAFGALLYEMLTGTPTGSERKAVKDRRLEAIVARCLAPDPAKRYASAADVAREVTAARNWKGRRRRLAFAAATLVIGGGSVLLYQLRTTPALLTVQDIVVLADFDNRTSEPVFGTALRQALAFDLQQSPYFRAIDDDQVRLAVLASGQPVDSRLTTGLARTVCVREGGKATLEGVIVSAAPKFLITLRAVNCRTGRTLAVEQVDAASKEEVVAALARASAAMRARLGESLPRVEGDNDSYQHRVTTASLEALDAFAAGNAESSRTAHAAASIPFYQRAVERDPQFALAWMMLGARYASAGDPARAREHIAKARELAAGVNERERLFIEAAYQQQHGDPQKQRETLEVLARRYPRDPMWHNTLSASYARTGEWQRALEEAQATIRTGPRLVQGYVIASAALVELNRVDEAKAVLRRAIAVGFDNAGVHETLFYLESAGSDEAAIARELSWFEQRVPGSPLPMRTIANRAAALGQYQRALDAYRAAQQRARRPGSPIRPENYAQEQATMEALLGHCRSSSERSAAALLDALCGSTAALEAVAQSQRATAGPVAYARGLALLKAGNAKEAAAFFDAMLAMRVTNWGPELPAAMVGRARAAVALGDAGAARRHYEMLFELWNGADQDVPLLVVARQELAALR
jgi:Flp pilus assembly protein TadD